MPQVQILSETDSTRWGGLYGGCLEIHFKRDISKKHACLCKGQGASLRSSLSHFIYLFTQGHIGLGYSVQSILDMYIILVQSTKYLRFLNNQTHNLRM